MKTALPSKFLNTPEDCQWLRDTALKALVIPPFQSFVFTGNEDCPQSIALYSERDPAISDKPLMRMQWSAELSEYL